jgi:FdhD protein
LADPIIRVPRLLWREGAFVEGMRAIPEETAVAFTYNTASYAVMMSTPQDLEDFAVGFSLTEGVIASYDDIESIDIVEEAVGIELRIWLKAPQASEFLGRRRKIAGPTGCGLCGIESLTEAMRPPPKVGKGRVFSPDQIMTALETLAPRQSLNHETRAVHAAGFFDSARGLVALREDVGRHNALDKLAGALARDGATADQGIVLLTSRVSVEMVQKSAAIGAPIVVAVSAPTALALRMAEACGMTLVAIARKDGFEIFTHPQRIVGATVGLRAKPRDEAVLAEINKAT